MRKVRLPGNRPHITSERRAREGEQRSTPRNVPHQYLTPSITPQTRANAHFSHFSPLSPAHESAWKDIAMPMASPKPCSHPGCRALVHDGTSRCLVHKRPAWSRTAQQVKRISGRRLQAQREALFAREPLCRECLKHGHTTLAAIRDHIQPLAEGGADTDDNVQPLCRDCSDVKTAGESRRGRGGRKSRTLPLETDPSVTLFRAQVLRIFCSIKPPPPGRAARCPPAAATTPTTQPRKNF